MKQPMKKNMDFDSWNLEEGVESFEDESYPVHYTNQTYISSPKSKKFKVGKNKFLPKTFLDREPRKKTESYINPLI